MAILLDRSPIVVSQEPRPDSRRAGGHRDAIDELCASTGRSPEIVARVFHAELAVLTATARVTDYLVLFAIRRARETLRRDGGQ